MASVSIIGDDSAASVDVARRSEILARLERLPFSRFHLRLAAILGVGTFFDAFDALTIATALAGWRPAAA